MVGLENPEESPCFGCGPQHPRGLRLRFERVDGADGTPEVLTRFVPKPDEIGWPGLFHHGLHFLVLNEVAYWAALTLTGKIWVLQGPATYSFDRLPRVGVSHVARARIVEQSPERLTIRATSATEEGKPCGSVVAPWRLSSRAAVERAHIELPSYLLPDLGP
ncbi:MAG TPA: hypothetical protein VEH28_07240 [Thermoplasmata archaeon]|nr:hypothetical protein [Thermoplasmata archaeon]